MEVPFGDEPLTVYLILKKLELLISVATYFVMLFLREF